MLVEHPYARDTLSFKLIAFISNSFISGLEFAKKSQANITACVVRKQIIKHQLKTITEIAAGCRNLRQHAELKSKVGLPVIFPK